MRSHGALDALQIIAVIGTWTWELCPRLSRKWHQHLIHKVPWMAQTRTRSATSWAIIGRLSHVVSKHFTALRPDSWICYLHLRDSAGAIHTAFRCSLAHTILQCIADEERFDAWWQQTTRKDDVRTVFGCGRNVNFSQSINSHRWKRKHGPVRDWRPHQREAR